MGIPKKVPLILGNYQVGSSVGWLMSRVFHDRKVAQHWVRVWGLGFRVYGFHGTTVVLEIMISGGGGVMLAQNPKILALKYSSGSIFCSIPYT